MTHELVPSTGRAESRGRPRPRRELSLFDRLVRVPLGFLWLIVLAIVAVPTILVMTLLYHLTDAFRRVRGASGDGRSSGRAVSRGGPERPRDPVSG
jgi:hypothetical protein